MRNIPRLLPAQDLDGSGAQYGQPNQHPHGHNQQYGS